MSRELSDQFKALYVTKIKGKDFIRFDGLLVLAKLDGWKGCRTTVIQLPNESNRNLAVVHAAVTDKDGNVFEAIGDCDDFNAPSKEIAVHKVRMAETRAVGRALRKMLGIDMVMLEELNLEEALDSVLKDADSGERKSVQPKSQSEPPKAQLVAEVINQEPAVKPQGLNGNGQKLSSNGDKPVTPEQVETIKRIMNEKHIPAAIAKRALMDICGKKTLDSATSREAERLIDYLRSLNAS